MAKVLVCDDDWDVTSALKAIIERMGPHEVVTCLHPLDALAQLENDLHYKCIISDYMMPGLDGIELLSVCAQKFPDIRRILITAAPTEPEVRGAMKQNIVQHLVSKPWSRTDLKLALSGL